MSMFLGGKTEPEMPYREEGEEWIEEYVPGFSYVHSIGPWRARKLGIWGVAKLVVNKLRLNGGDVTKVGLPAGFCEPYSALELCASRCLGWFPVLNAGNETKSPVERMAAVMNWVYAAFKRSYFHKKPYNPVLGECHQCHIKTDENETYFIAEQVSHHPPLGAFVLEDVKQNITIKCNVEFAVKYHGTWVSLTQHGILEITYHNFNETYVVVDCIPSLAIKNVLWGTRYHTWMNDLDFFCAETQVYVRTNYADKNRKTEVTGGIYVGKEDLDNDRATYKVEGFWGKKEVIRLVKTVPAAPEGEVEKYPKKEIIVCSDEKDNPKQAKMLYPPWEEKNEWDSTKIWANVTRNVLEGDLMKADEAKSTIEQAQRDRIRDGFKQQPRQFFEKDEDDVWNLRPEFSRFKGAAPAGDDAADVDVQEITEKTQAATLDDSEDSDEFFDAED